MQDRKLSLNSTLPTPMAKNRRVIYMSIKKIDLQTYFYNFRTLRVFRRLSLPLPAAVPSWPLGTDRQKPNFVTKKKKKNVSNNIRGQWKLDYTVIIFFTTIPTTTPAHTRRIMQTRGSLSHENGGERELKIAINIV